MRGRVSTPRNTCPLNHSLGEDALIRVVLVEDQSLVRASLASILTAHGMQIMAESARGSEVLALVQKHQPDILLLDLALPDVDGVEALRRLRLHGQSTPTLIVTGAGTAFRLKSSIEAGANGFLTKTASPEELIQAVTIVARGGMYITQSVAKIATGTISPRQQRILEGVVYGLTNDEIASRLHVSRGTVKLEISNLFQTLRCSDRTHLACEAAVQGLVSLPPL